MERGARLPVLAPIAPAIAAALTAARLPRLWRALLLAASRAVAGLPRLRRALLLAASRAVAGLPRLRRALLLAAALAVPAATPLVARATVFMTRPQALALAFPGARVERRAFALTETQVQAVQARAKVKVESKLVAAYAAWRGDTLAGAAFFDMRTVRTMPAVLMVLVRPDTTVGRVDVLAFHEPPDFRPPARWLGTFASRRLDDGLWPRRDLRNLSGATLSARAVTESVRLALALYEVVAAPALLPAPHRP